MPDMMNRVALSNRAVLLASALAAVLGAGMPLASLRAQEVVQALPPREAAQLNAALRRLATRPTDLDALVSAGNASLALNDPAAAQGFFARAATAAPSDSRVLLGLARVALEERRPVQALQGFAQAETAGVRPLDMAADRALAYDLVGDNATAQGIYRSVLAVGDSAEIRRRLAISLAISGNRTEFERILYPLLKDEDRAAFRTRAFGLAIMGRTDDAVGIADAMMPTDLALRMAPYLRYMPRLTKAQQAAAANLGAFPAATDIGRDTADIAGYTAAGARIAARADTSLTPTGAPMGARAQQGGASAASSVRRRPDRESETKAVPTQAPVTRVAQAELPPARNTPAPVTGSCACSLTAAQTRGGRGQAARADAHRNPRSRGRSSDDCRGFCRSRGGTGGQGCANGGCGRCRKAGGGAKTGRRQGGQGRGNKGKSGQGSRGQGGQGEGREGGGAGAELDPGGCRA